MGDSSRSPTRAPEPEVRVEDLGHPRGTLAIVIIFGLLFLIGWLGLFFLGFLQRGAPHH